MDLQTTLGRQEIASFCKEECRTLLKKLKGADELVDTIRKIIINSPGQSLCLQDVAKELAMSPRTLSRRLRERNQTFQRIIDDVREELGKEYLSATNLSVAQISDRLGFSEPAVFRRAFKKWTGINISVFKEQGAHA